MLDDGMLSNADAALANKLPATRNEPQRANFDRGAGEPSRSYHYYFNFRTVWTHAHAHCWPHKQCARQTNSAADSAWATVKNNVHIIFIFTFH